MHLWRGRNRRPDRREARAGRLRRQRGCARRDARCAEAAWPAAGRGRRDTCGNGACKRIARRTRITGSRRGSREGARDGVRRGADRPVIECGHAGAHRDERRAVVVLRGPRRRIRRAASEDDRSRWVDRRGDSGGAGDRLRGARQLPAQRTRLREASSGQSSDSRRCKGQAGRPRESAVRATSGTSCGAT